jgi:PAS domain S-box-containing protein
MPIFNLERILASTACPAFVSDGKGQVLGLNISAEALLGFDSASIQGLPCREVFAGRDKFGNRFCLERCAVREMAAHDEAVNPFNVRLKTASGAMLNVAISVVALRDNGGKQPAILHMLNPMEHAVDERGREEGSQSIDRELKLSANGNAFKGLTPREHEILALLTAGKSSHDIACATGISLVTVRNHLKRIFPKLGVHSQGEAVSFAFRNKFI